MPPRSMAPYGETLPQAQKRLHEPLAYSWPERVCAALWAKRNELDEMSPVTPLLAILHECDARCQSSPLEHYYEEPSQRDREVIAAFIQWLGTHVGRDFLDEVCGKLHHFSNLKPEERFAHVERLCKEATG